MNIIELAKAEGLHIYPEHRSAFERFANAVIKARDAELQAQSEPVAWMTPMGNVFAKHQLTEAQKADLHPLYTHPAPVQAQSEPDWMKIPAECNVKCVAWRVSFNDGKDWTLWETDPQVCDKKVIVQPLFTHSTCVAPQAATAAPVQQEK